MKRILCASLACALLSSCSLVPDYNRPDVQTQAGWKNAGDQALSDQLIARDWWRNFDSAELDSFMTRALTENNDLRASLQRIEQARANARIAGASLLPTVDATGNVSASRTDPGGSAKADNENSWNAGANISYELDLFGANRAGVQSAKASLAGSMFDSQALGLVVMGDVANTYFLVLNLRERVAIAQQNLDNANDLLRIVNARFDAGASSALEVAQQKTALAGTQAALSSLKASEAQAENALAVLLALTPQNLSVAGTTLKALTIPDIALVQPSTLLERRPDVRSAEQALVAANADIGAARAAFFPSISLGTGVSLAASPISSPVTIAVDAASSILAPIFSGGALEGRLALSQARKAELVENYRKAIYVAVQEVEDALAAMKAAREREAALQTGVAEAQKSYDLSRQLYDSGAVDFQTLLNAQTALLQTQDSYAAVRFETLQASVNLYKAMGGGWRMDEAAAAAPQPALAASGKAGVIVQQP